MQAYLFDENTKEYLEELQAQIDPLESEIVGEDIYLLPANSTFEKPLYPKDGYKVLWNGNSWEYAEIPMYDTKPELTLDELKLTKRAEINQSRDEAEQGGFEYMGKVFDSDQVSCIRISSAAQAMQMVAMSDETPTITWTCQDNSTIDLNPQELIGLVVALAQWSNSCHQKATTLKAQIDACDCKEALDRIKWE